VTLSDGFRCGGDDQIQVVEVYEKGEKRGRERRREEEKSGDR
jgi:hypothetical protein